jgi:hypothetical protein
MITYEWKILEIYAHNNELDAIDYYVKAKDGKNVVESKGYHKFKSETINLPFEQIKEENLIDWLNKDQTQDDVSLIKSNLEKQLQELGNNKKIQAPWLADTFTPQG